MGRIIALLKQKGGSGSATLAALSCEVEPEEETAREFAAVATEVERLLQERE